MKGSADVAVMVVGLFWSSFAIADVAEPALKDRQISLLINSPGARSNPIFKADARKMTAGALRALIAKRRPRDGAAALDCVGGYTGAVPGSLTDVLAFDVTTDRGEREPFSALPDSATAHEVCMVKAREVAARVRR